MKHSGGAPKKPAPEPVARRSFFVRALTVVVSGLLVLFPLAAVWGVLTDPWRRRKGAAAAGGAADGLRYLRVGPLDMLPADGVPRQFAVTADVVDAWTRAPAQRIGSVFLSRTDGDGGPQILAFTAACPHLGCAVDFVASAGVYECPCHASAFAKDGKKLFGPSLRGLDPLPHKLVDNGGQQEIWIAFERFRPGIAERIPIA